MSLYTIITHAGIAAGIAAGVGRAFSRVCLFVCLSLCLLVRTLTGKRLELSTPKLVHIYSIVVARHALTQRSKGQRSRSHGYENRHGRTVASDACCHGRCRRGSACLYDCLCFLVPFVFIIFCIISIKLKTKKIEAKQCTNGYNGALFDDHKVLCPF